MLILSLTTIPCRIPHLEQILSNLSLQTLKPDVILINVCEKYRRFGDGININELVNLENIKNLKIRYPSLAIKVLERDYGPLTKLMGALQFTMDKRDIIVTVDDDITYPDNLLEQLVFYFDKTNHKICYGLSALNFVGVNGNVKRCRTHLRVFNILEGFGGVIYSRQMFDDDFTTYINSIIENDYCFRSDDLTIHNYLHYRGIRKRVICTDQLNLQKLQVLNLDDAGLNNLGTKNIIKLARQYLVSVGLFYFF